MEFVNTPPRDRKCPSGWRFPSRTDGLAYVMLLFRLLPSMLKGVGLLFHTSKTEYGEG